MSQHRGTTEKLEGGAYRNLLLLACCQAVGQAGNTMMFAATALSIISFYPHRDLATLPLTLRKQGIRACDFKVSFERAFVRELVKRMKAGWTAKDFAKLPAPRAKPDDVEVARVVVEGPGGTVTMDCHARPNRRWHASAGDIDTGCPPSIVARMIADGMISAPGVWAPEAAIPAAPFFAELRRRGLNIVERRT